MKKLYNPTEEKWKIIPAEFFKRMGGVSALNCNTPATNLKGAESIPSYFWKEALKSWADFNWNKETSGKGTSISDPWFNNINIKYKEKIIFVERLITSNIILVGDFYNGNRIMNFTDFINRHGSYNGVEFDFNAIYNALKKLDINPIPSAKRKDF